MRKGMNRRQFTAGLTALGAAPAIPARALAAATPAATGSVPAAARFWAIYMSHLHGVCTPQALKVMVGVDTAKANSYLSQLLADGVIKPQNFLANALAGKSTTGAAPQTGKKDVWERVKSYILEDETPEEAAASDIADDETTTGEPT